MVGELGMEGNLDLNAFACKEWLEENKEVIERLSEFFSVFSNPTRLKILLLLSKKEMCVGRIASILGMDQSAVSAQLKILRNLNLVKAKRHGKYVRYRLNNRYVKGVLKEGFKHVLKIQE